jgi:hypothetical protein
VTLVFTTLGPEGSCHENAVRNYLRFHELTAAAEIELVLDVDEGLERVRWGESDYLVQCSAHLNVHLTTERYRSEIPVVDTFIYPTREIAVLSQAHVVRPRTLGLAAATAGYVDTAGWEELIYEPTKPVVGRKLLAGAYDSGITTIEYLERSGGALRLDKYIGSVVTTWLVYGTRPRYAGDVIGTPCRDYLLGKA